METGLEAKDGVRGCCSGSEKIKTHHIKLGARKAGGMGERSSWEVGWTALGDQLDRHTGREGQRKAPRFLAEMTEGRKVPCADEAT